MGPFPKDRDEQIQIEFGTETGRVGSGRAGSPHLERVGDPECLGKAVFAVSVKLVPTEALLSPGGYITPVSQAVIFQGDCAS